MRRPTPTTFAEAFARGAARGVPAAVRLFASPQPPDVADPALAAALGALAASDDARAPRLVERLLDAGAPIDAVDAAGRTALAYAVAARRAPMIERLLRLGADPDAGLRSAVATAVFVGDARALRTLARAGGGATSRAPLWTQLVVRAVLDATPLEATVDFDACARGDVDPVALWLALVDLPPHPGAWREASQAVAGMTRLRALTVLLPPQTPLANAVLDELAGHPTLEVLVVCGGAWNTMPKAAPLTDMPRLAAVHLADQPRAEIDVPGVEVSCG